MFREKPREWSYSGDRQLKVKYYVENIPFHFHWDLQEDLTGFSEAVAIPLLLALKQTKDREEELLKIVQQKDEEIQDLRRSGGSLVNSEWVISGSRRRFPDTFSFRVSSDEAAGCEEL